MDSLAGYESDAELTENGPKEIDNLEDLSPVGKDSDTNYESVPMDESDQEMNNNVEEYYSADAQDGVNPEDAPLVFRTVTQPRNDIRTTPLHRSSSDMEVEDSDSEQLEDDLAVTAVDEESNDETLPEQNDTNHKEYSSTKTDYEPERALIKKEEEGEDDGNEVPSRLRDEKEPATKRSRRARSLEEENSERKRRSPSRSPRRKMTKSGEEGRRLQEGFRKSERRKEERLDEELAFYRSPPARGRPVRNPMLQIQKKKLLWAHKANEVNGSNVAWDATVFKNDFDGKMADKFKRLMGMKQAGNNVSVNEDKKDSVLEEQDKMLSNMEAQYQQARLATHMQRGCGLGYGASHPSSHSNPSHLLTLPLQAPKLSKPSASSTMTLSPSNT